MKRYEVGGNIYRSRQAAIDAAIAWWATACGTQAADLTGASEDEARKTLPGWCRIVGGTPEDQAELDAEVVANAIEVIRAARKELPDPGRCPCGAIGSWEPEDVVVGTSGPEAKQVVWPGCPWHAGQATGRPIPKDAYFNLDEKDGKSALRKQ